MNATRIENEPAEEYAVGGIPSDRCPEMTSEEREIVGQAIAILKRRLTKHGDAMGSPRVVKSLVTLELGMDRDEVFAVLYLDNRHRLIELVRHFRGTVDSAAVHPRAVVVHALRVNAAAVILAHNHPSGTAQQSAADVEITREIKKALKLVDVRTLDHVITGGDDYLSFAEEGLM